MLNLRKEDLTMDDGQTAFLNLFLQILKIPQAFLGEQMNLQCEYICDDLINPVIKPLLL